MEFDPAIVLFGAVVLLLVAILIGVLYAARDRRTQVSEEWVQDLDWLHARLEAIALEIALLAAQIRHLEGVEGLQREVTYEQAASGGVEKAAWRGRPHHGTAGETASLRDFLSYRGTSGRSEPEGAALVRGPSPLGNGRVCLPI